MAVAYLRDQPSPSVMRYRAARSEPCTADLIDVFHSSGKRALITIADVWGRDAQAQAHARYLRHIVRLLADKRSPGSLLECANLLFHRRLAQNGDDRFATLFLAALQGRRLTYASAGHEFALLLCANGRHCRLPTTGMILGINVARRYQERALTVAPGDWLILATDGITEAQDVDGECFGTSGVVRNAVSAIAASADDPAAWILEAARTHGRGGFVDDASVLCVRFS